MPSFLLTIIACGTCFFAFLLGGAAERAISYESRYEEGFEAGKLHATKPDVNNICAAWLFQTSLKEAKKTICTGKRK